MRMNDREWTRQVKEKYPPGTRIELVSLCNEERDMPSGLRGTVVRVDDWPQLHMQWDNGRTLALIPGEDSFRVIEQEEVQGPELTL